LALKRRLGPDSRTTTHVGGSAEKDLSSAAVQVAVIQTHPMRRLGRVLILILQPLRPSSDFVGAIQIVVFIGVPLLGALLPFGLTDGWTVTRAALVVVGAFALLSLRGAYQLHQDNEVLLAQTFLQKEIAAAIRGLTEVERRVKRIKTDQIPRKLADEVIASVGATIRNLNDRAPDIGSELLHSSALGPNSLDRKEQLAYLKQTLATLRKLGRDLR
jgi:hypothetical protein